MFRKFSIAATLCCVPVFAAHAAPSVAEGKGLFESFRCADCHGTDAKTSVTKNTPPLAGMNPDDIFLKTKRFIESRSHEQVLQGCGEPPTHVQIKKIADYLATLPR